MKMGALFRAGCNLKKEDFCMYMDNIDKLCDLKYNVCV